MIGTQNSHLLSSVSDNKNYKLTSTTTMGIVIDGPSDVKETSGKILIHFERGTASVIYQLSDIGMDGQILEDKIRSVIYQTCYFAPNILRDDYVIHFLAFRLECFDCSNIP